MEGIRGRGEKAPEAAADTAEEAAVGECGVVGVGVLDGEEVDDDNETDDIDATNDGGF